MAPGLHPYASAVSASESLRRQRPRISTSVQDLSQFRGARGNATLESSSPIVFARTSMIEGRRGSEKDWKAKGPEETGNITPHSSFRMERGSIDVGDKRRRRCAALSGFDFELVGATLGAILRESNLEEGGAPLIRKSMTVKGDFPRSLYSSSDEDDDATVHRHDLSSCGSFSTSSLPLTPDSSDEEFPSIIPLNVPKSSLPGINSRIGSISSVSRVFAPLDIAAANNLDLKLDLTLTGVLEEVRQEAERNRHLRQRENSGTVLEADHDEHWIDIDDDEEGIEYYSADIATYISLAESPLPLAPSISPLSSVAGPLSARPDSLPPPPHAFFHGLRPSAHEQMRRPSTTSLASAISKASSRSSYSTKSNRSLHKQKRKTSRAHVSAALNVGRSLQHVRYKASRASVFSLTAEVFSGKAPSPLLDPTLPGRTLPPTLPAPSCPLPPVPQSNPLMQAKDLCRPPPRFSLPSDITFDEDIFRDSVTIMSQLKEADEAEFESFVGNIIVDIPKNIVAKEEELIGPFTTLPSRHPYESEQSVQFAEVPESSVSPLLVSGSESSTALTPFILSPNSPSSSSSYSSNSDARSTDADAESLFSSYSGRPSDAASIYCDNEGRVLRSRWSVSTFASVPPSAGSGRSSFFTKLQLPKQLPARLGARLRSGSNSDREKKEREKKEKKEKQREKEREKEKEKEREREREKQMEKEREKEKEKEPAPLEDPNAQPRASFPAFPTPTVRQPKRRSDPPGKYVPKVELMPEKVRKQAIEQQQQNERSSSATSSVSPTGASRGSSRLAVSTLPFRRHSRSLSLESSKPLSLKGKERERIIAPSLATISDHSDVDADVRSKEREDDDTETDTRSLSSFTFISAPSLGLTQKRKLEPRSGSTSPALSRAGKTASIGLSSPVWRMGRRNSRERSCSGGSSTHSHSSAADAAKIAASGTVKPTASHQNAPKRPLPSPPKPVEILKRS